MTIAKGTGIAVIAAIAMAALLPQPWKGRTATFGWWHDCAHIAAFTLAFVLSTWQSQSARTSLGIAFFLLLFGALLEVLQTRFYGNRLEYPDMVANALGLAIGVPVRRVLAAHLRR